MTTEIKRIYSKDMEFVTDLFKLEVTNMLKNVSYDDKNPILQNLEHCHTFRTFDSNAKKLTKCNSVGGHWHDVTVSVTKEGTLKAIVSKAIGTKFGDNHTHKAVYVRSDRLKKRKLNPEAQASIAYLETIPPTKKTEETHGN